MARVGLGVGTDAEVVACAEEGRRDAHTLQHAEVGALRGRVGPAGRLQCCRAQRPRLRAPLRAARRPPVSLPRSGERRAAAGPACCYRAIAREAGARAGQLGALRV